jgi:hypothetical protein
MNRPSFFQTRIIIHFRKKEKKLNIKWLDVRVEHSLLSDGCAGLSSPFPGGVVMAGGGYDD